MKGLERRRHRVADQCRGIASQRTDSKGTVWQRISQRKEAITAKIEIDRFRRQLEQRVKCSKPGGVPAACYKDVLDLLTAEINTQTRKSFRDKKG